MVSQRRVMRVQQAFEGGDPPGCCSHLVRRLSHEGTADWADQQQVTGTSHPAGVTPRQKWLRKWDHSCPSIGESWFDKLDHQLCQGNLDRLPNKELRWCPLS